MALSEESRRRLEELGRRLPQPLPRPEPEAAKPAPKRHRIETETDPVALFQELMQASPDGNVPPHLLDRLRELEQQQRAVAPPPLSAKRRQGQPRPPGKQAVGSSSRSSDEPDPLYVSFEQMLLEQEEDEAL